MVAANLISLVLIFAVFYFMIIRPQKKRQQQQSQMLENLRTGDKVVTIGGIHGTVVAIDNDTVIIATGDGEDTTLIMSKVAISRVVEEEKKEIVSSETASEEILDEDVEEFEDEDEDEDEYEDEDEEDDEEKKETSK
ncbi:preprotein translocase subunit YajC [Clostridium cylindrosporum]|uniref:Preprotein translocase, YajC subunit n=1 Tax=Clostridium cylindrosporum DSM 605 TaxID=1121307 RepID=A0A0J8D526_CLOCY|nr:preprotein translocase subunit YajC [Clostridium cylindrosporum]KMT21265.1 preprotein translocase, YajC subunit [Clostridium cylindrosporum DSM 605]